METKDNFLVACGGTGAHVTLAFLRLHLLGYALGFFGERKSLRFPDLYLIDQDSGSGADGQATAWQEVQEIQRRHPGNLDTHYAFGGRLDSPKISAVSPLPIGPNRNWYKEPKNSLGNRFFGSPLLELLATKEQKEIDFSLGMMGSPAVGSLLFQLKEYDLKSIKNTRLNNDDDYHALRDGCIGSNVVVAGSGVGGTGASVAPTFACQCANDGASVMAVMVQRWFHFDWKNSRPHLRTRAQERDKKMQENAASGIASYGQDLADNAATVLVGVPDSALVDRQYTSDNQQPSRDSYTHVIAGLSAMQYFTNPEDFENGLWGMSASDTEKLTGDLAFGDSTLRDLVEKATVFVYVLETLVKVLCHPAGAHRKRYPQIYNKVRDLIESDSPEPVGKQLETYLKDYRNCLRWLTELNSDLEPQEVDEGRLAKSFTRESASKKRLSMPEAENALPNNSDPEKIAASLFHWIAEWVQDGWNKTFITRKKAAAEATVSISSGYWPQQHSTGLSPEWGSVEPGQLVKSKHDSGKSLDSLFDRALVTQDGWPHPAASAEHFRFQLRHDSDYAGRKLELLLVGIAQQKLRLEPTELRIPRETRITLGHLVGELRNNDYVGLAEYRIIKPGRSDDEVIGFSSPHTLLCPVPGLTSDDWNNLWIDITDGSDSEVWDQDDPSWGLSTRNARGSIANWIGVFEEYLTGTAALAHWMKSAIDSRKAPWAFSGNLLQIRLENGHTVALEIPVHGAYHGQISDSGHEQATKEKFLEEIPEFRKNGDFEWIEEFKSLDRREPITLIWREHLGTLQEDRRILYWNEYRDDNREIDRLQIVWFDSAFNRCVVEFRNTRVIDLNEIRSKYCIRIPQEPIPSSSVARNEPLYPDLPLRREYIGLVLTEHEEDLSELLIQGVTDENLLNIGAPPEVDDSSVTWTLKLKGRANPQRISILLDEASCVRAHWMVWPNFRAKIQDKPWRPYYTYSDFACSESTSEGSKCRVQTLGTDILFVGQERIAISECGFLPNSSRAFGPVGFESHRHVGGPPIAFSLYDRQRKRDLGIYLVKDLKAYDRAERWSMGVDFGTSHTLAAVKERPDSVDSEVVELTPELKSKKSLTLHVSQNWSGNPEQFESWLPMYREELPPGAESLLPSELLAAKEVSKLTGSDIREWVPIKDFTIPAMDVRNGRLLERVISGFKWEVVQDGLRPVEMELREFYLAFALEIFVAEQVQEWRMLPESIQITFMYPLRSAMSGVIDSFQESLQRVIERCSGNLGCTIELAKPDDVPEGDHGLYSESHAAKGGTNTYGQILLVGDLGGGTLDLLISAYGRQESEQQFAEVADSVKLGGHHLLDTLAKSRSHYLPDGWSPDHAQCAAQLRAWMRSKGSSKLFGWSSHQTTHQGLGLKGFHGKDGGNRGRGLIDRYFSLIADYMARSLVAYMKGDWWPKISSEDRQRLEIILQLRGNGWRLWYEPGYDSIQRHMCNLIRSHAHRFWELVGIAAPRDELWNSPETSEELLAKVDPVRTVVSKCYGPRMVQDKCHKFPLVDFEVFIGMQGNRQVAWHERLPLQDVPEGSAFRIQIGDFNPPISWSSAQSLGKVEDIEDNLKKSLHQRINAQLATGGGRLDPPVAEEVWEHVFKSAQQKERTARGK